MQSPLNPTSISNPSNPADQAQLQAMLRQLASTDPKMREFMTKLALGGQRVVLPVPYWSTVEFAADATKLTAGSISIDSKPRKAFQYAFGQTMTVAGSTASATFSDTNLLTQAQTLNNSDVYIYGVTLEPLPGSEPLILQQLWSDGLIELSTDGNTQIRIGTPAMFPAAGGLYGTGYSADVLTAADQAGPIQTGGAGPGGGIGAPVSYLANGNPMSSNFLKFAQPFKWSAVGGGGSDCQLSISFTCTRFTDFVLAAARASATGVQPWDPPTVPGDPGTGARIRVRLVAQSVSKRGENT